MDELLEDLETLIETCDVPQGVAWTPEWLAARLGEAKAQATRILELDRDEAFMRCTDG